MLEKDVRVFAEALSAGADVHDAVMRKSTPLKSQQKCEEWRPWPERHISKPGPAITFAA